MATDTPRPAAQTITVASDQLVPAAMAALRQAIERINLHPDSLYCGDCRAIWSWRIGPLADVLDRALAHECPPARPVALVGTDKL